MLHTKFRGNRPAGSGDFLRGRGGHLGHVTSIMLINFHFHVPESFHTKGQEMILTLYTHILTQSHLVVCIYQLSGHRLQKFLKNRLFSLFPIEKPKFPNLTLP